LCAVFEPSNSIIIFLEDKYVDTTFIKTPCRTRFIENKILLKWWYVSKLWFGRGGCISYFSWSLFGRSPYHWQRKHYVSWDRKIKYCLGKPLIPFWIYHVIGIWSIKRVPERVNRIGKSFTVSFHVSSSNLWIKDV